MLTALQIKNDLASVCSWLCLDGVNTAIRTKACILPIDDDPGIIRLSVQDCGFNAIPLYCPFGLEDGFHIRNVNGTARISHPIIHQLGGVGLGQIRPLCLTVPGVGILNKASQGRHGKGRHNSQNDKGNDDFD